MIYDLPKGDKLPLSSDRISSSVLGLLVSIEGWCGLSQRLFVDELETAFGRLEVVLL